MESIERRNIKAERVYEIEDYEDRSYYGVLTLLPHELALRHVKTIEEQKLSDEKAIVYLKDVLTKRHEVITETFISDEILREILKGKEEDFFRSLETTVLQSPNIGEGQTADVKRLDIPVDSSKIPIAIKYLLRPTQHTLSAAAEHDMIEEVERIEIIEEIEHRAHVELIRVPHPYFHHKNERLQCYGMEHVDGATLLDATTNKIDSKLREQLQTSLSKISEKELLTQVDIFFEEMHSYCLHGDIKPKNIMVDRSGVFFIIDFGQSALTSKISEDKIKFFDDLKVEEVRRAKVIISRFLKKLFQKKNT